MGNRTDTGQVIDAEAVSPKGLGARAFRGPRLTGLTLSPQLLAAGSEGYPRHACGTDSFRHSPVGSLANTHHANEFAACFCCSVSAFSSICMARPNLLTYLISAMPRWLLAPCR